LRCLRRHQDLPRDHRRPTDHITSEQLDRDDLLFNLPRDTTEPDEPRDSNGRDDPDRETVDLGLTEPNADGRTYPHGTMTGYNLGACRCRHCRAAAARYRATRRAAGKDGLAA